MGDVNYNMGDVNYDNVNKELPSKRINKKQQSPENSNQAWLGSVFPKFDEICRRPASIFNRGITSLEGYRLSPEQELRWRAGSRVRLEAGLELSGRVSPPPTHLQAEAACAPRCLLLFSLIEEHTGLTPTQASASP